MVRGTGIRAPARRAAASLLLVAGCAGLGGRSREPGRSEVDPQVTAAVAARVPESCRAEVAAALTAGEQLTTPCAEPLSRAADEALAAGRQRSFGIVDRTTVHLASMGLVLSKAYLCRRRPLRAPGQTSLDVGAARYAGCVVRRYAGPLTISVASTEGTVLPVMTVRSDEDGRVEVSFAEVDALLRARGRGGLSPYATLLVGRDGWAGRVDLTQLRAQLADWHATWVGRGRGSPALFAALHPEAEAAAGMRTRALEASLKRQAEDAAAVERGELSPRRFLERHVWSPYRSVVEQKDGGSSP
ncbi:hypothetical protein [Nannocystis punicea]|uniref:Lipoprotein n=1 Tax=Nannocystis punicea TaxID=2995304 RepID=A0ABY7H4X6_9BACT|nr:hypothetical protein [Nannocystis poenicansa]WAS94029.1 hypothetical protein O0S08_48495 [Nannocystis poenicansa]